MNVFAAVITCFIYNQRIRIRKMKEWSQGSQGSCQKCSCDRFLKRNVKNTTLPSHVKMTIKAHLYL